MRRPPPQQRAPQTRGMPPGRRRPSDDDPANGRPRSDNRQPRAPTPPHSSCKRSNSQRSSCNHDRNNTTTTTSSGGGNHDNSQRTRSLLELASQGARSIFQRKKEVRFRRYDQIRDIPSARDYPQHIFQALYYTRTDMRRVSAERKRSIAQLSDACRQQKLRQQNTDDTDDDSVADSTRRPQQHNPVGITLPTHGYGHIYPHEWGIEPDEESDARMRKSREIITSVLLEQELQWEEYGSVDQQFLAEVYHEATFQAQLEAHQRALRAEIEIQRYLYVGGRWGHEKHLRRHARANNGSRSKRPSCMGKGLRQPKRQLSMDRHGPTRSQSESALLPVRGLVRQNSDSEVSVSSYGSYSGDESDSSSSCSVPTPVTVSKRPIPMPVRQNSDPKLFSPLDSPQTTPRQKPRPPVPKRPPANVAVLRSVHPPQPPVRVQSDDVTPERCRAPSDSKNRNDIRSPPPFGPQSSISMPPTSGGLSSWVRI